jgi:hypothetical protein
MQNIVVLGKDEYKEIMEDKIRTLEAVVDGGNKEFESELDRIRSWLAENPELSRDLKWTKRQLKISGEKCNGYRIGCADLKDLSDKIIEF